MRERASGPLHHSGGSSHLHARLEQGQDLLRSTNGQLGRDGFHGKVCHFVSLSDKHEALFGV